MSTPVVNRPLNSILHGCFISPFFAPLPSFCCQYAGTQTNLGHYSLIKYQNKASGMARGPPADITKMISLKVGYLTDAF